MNNSIFFGRKIQLSSLYSDKIVMKGNLIIESSI